MSLKHFTEYIHFNGIRWNPIDLDNGLQLSIQASVLHYCDPRMNGLDADRYYAWEVAVLKKGQVVNPQCGEEFFSESDNVYPYLAADNVQDLFVALNRLTEYEVDKIEVEEEE